MSKERQLKEIVLSAEQVQEMKQKLRSLSFHLPNEHETTYNLANFLADRLTHQGLTPRGFLLVAALSLEDLERGVNSITGEPITRAKYKIADQPTAVYRILNLFIPKIAKAVTPPEFASQVQEIYDSANKDRVRVYGEEGIPEVELPGRDPYEIVRREKRLPARGILLEANFAHKGNGVFTVYQYDNLEKVRLDEQGEGRQYQYLHTFFHWSKDTKSRQLELGYENPNYLAKAKEPYNRGETVSYIPVGFSELDRIDLPGSGRLLILKKPRVIGNLSTRLDQHPWADTIGGKSRQLVRWFNFEDVHGVAETVKVIARDLMGVDPNGAKIMRDEVGARLTVPSD